MARRGARIRFSRRRKRRRQLLLIVLLLIFIGTCSWLLFLDPTHSQKRAHVTHAASSDGWIRGVLFDSRHKRLAETIEQVSVYARTREIVSISDTAAKLADVLSLNRASLESRLKRGTLRVGIVRQISQEQEEELDRLALPGIYMKREWRRSYPNGAMASHLLGFSESGVGLVGVEAQYDQLLANHEAEGHGRRDLLLSLDLKIQKSLEEVLATIRRSGTVRGLDMRVVGCIMDARSGEIVALGQLPGFDPNDFADYDPEIFSSMMFAPMLIPAPFRVLLRDASIFYRPQTRVEEYGGWSMAPRAQTGRQLQLFTALNLDRRIYADFYSPGRSQAPLEGHLLQESRRRGLQMIPEVSTPMTLLYGLTTLLHGLPAGEPSVISRIVSKDGSETVIPKRKMEGESPEMNQQGVDRLFHAMGTKGRAMETLEGSASGTLPAAGGSEIFVQNRVVLADIPSGEGALMVLIVTEVRGYAPFSSSRLQKDGRLNLSRLLDEKLGRVGIQHLVVTGGAADLLPPEKASGDNWQESRSPAQQKPVKHNVTKGPVKMPDLHGLSLRKSLRLLEGIPVKLTVEGTGRVTSQSPEAGTLLKKGSLCRLVLTQKKLKIFHEKRQE